MRDLGHVVNRENAEIGVLICLEEPTRAMREEAVSAGFYESKGWHLRGNVPQETGRECIDSSRRGKTGRSAQNDNLGTVASDLSF